MAESALEHHVLVLNKNWQAIGTTTVRSAIVLISRESAKGVCPESFSTYDWEKWLSQPGPVADHYIKTPSSDVPAPQIILLTKYDDVYCENIKFHSRAIYKRDDYSCQYCGKRFKVEDLTIDHVIPRAKGGPTNWENCVTACYRCNNNKSDKTLKELGLKLPKKPTKPEWSPVFHIKPENRPASWKSILRDK